MVDMDCPVQKDQTLVDQVGLHELLINSRKHLLCLFIYLSIALVFSLISPQYISDPFTINIWCIISSILLIIGLLINHTLVIEPQISNSIKTFFLYLCPILSGMSISIGISIFNFDTAHPLTYEQTIRIYITFIFYLALHTTALIYLTDNYKIYLCFIIPSLFPLILLYESSINLKDNLLLTYYIGIHLYIIMILYLGFHFFNSKKNIIFQNMLVEALTIQKNHEHQLNQNLLIDLKDERNRSEFIKQELQRHNTLLEEKVQERTFDIERMNARLERSHQNLEMAHETAGIASWDWDIRNHLIDTSNFLPVFGYNIKNMDHYIHHMNEFIHPDDLLHVKSEMRRHLRGFTTRYEAKYRMFHQTEQWIWVHDMGRVIQRDPISRKALRMVGIRRNIHHEKKAEERLKLSASVFEKAAQGIFILDEKLNYVDANPYYLSLIGFEDKQLLGRHVFDITKQNHPELQQLHLQILRQLMSKGEFEGEIIEELNNGKELPLWMHINAIRDTQGKISQYIGIITDLTERKISEKRLSYLQTYDALTDLPNRNYFNNQLHSYLIHSLKLLSSFAVIRINLDRFRYYNELLNHQGGDELLRQVAQRLRRVNADAVVVARLNADDFSVIFEMQEHSVSLIDHCNNIIKAFEEPFKINNQELIMTISIGVATFPEHGRQMDSLNSHAELALLEAKRIGGNAIRIYHDDKRLSSVARVNLESELRRAIQQKELVVYYQPKLNCSTQRIEGFEALVRWDHPEHGILPPAQFIPLAEETSLISDIGKLVLEMTCAQIKKWADLGFKHLNVSVNIVAQQIHRGQLIEEIDFFLKKYSVSSRQLELEITETSIMENTDDVKNIMRQLKQRAIKISLDDFGTGYASFAYLAQYSFDIIKIDRSFVSKIGSSNQNAIVKAIIAMAKAMGKLVVAEGVETEDQYHFLMREGCDFLQGYLIGKPMPNHNATELLFTHTSPYFTIP